MNIHISGNLDGRTVVFLAGWPDTPEVFRDNIMVDLAPHYRLVGITLPGFDNNSPLFLNGSKTRTVGPPVPLLGYSFDELVDLFEIAILAVMEHRLLERPMLIAHDWGCIIAYEFLLTRPYFFSRVVMLDVGGPVSSTTLLTSDNCDGESLLYFCWRVAFIFLYHLLIIAAYIVLPDFLGRRALRFVLRAARRPQYKYVSSPATKSDKISAREFVLVSSYVQAEKKCQARWWQLKSWCFADVVNGIINFGQDTSCNDSVNSIDAAFHPSRFYHAKGSMIYTLPPHPNATGVSYTCFSRQDNYGICDTRRMYEGSNKSSCFCRSDKSLEKTQKGADSVVDVDPAWGWIYLRYWMLRLSRLLPASQRFLIPVSVPLLFLYGTQKPVQLHTPQWVEYVEVKGRCDGSEVVGFPGGHWFFAECGNRRKVAERVADFLDRDSYESLVG